MWRPPLRLAASSARCSRPGSRRTTRFDLATLDLSDARLPPAWEEGGSRTYLLGTDDQGRDILSALMYGARISLFVGLAAVLLSVVVGVGLGLLSGFRRRQGRRLHHARVRRDAVVPVHPGRAADRRRGPRDVPQCARDAGLRRADLAIALTGWVQYARTVRGSTLVERNKEYVQAARVIGVRAAAHHAPHVLPNVLGPVLVLATIQVARPSSPRPRCPSWAWACRPPARRWAR
jgi:peptide/nickel transport system permease protein